MEPILVLVLGLLLFLVVGAVQGIVANARVKALREEVAKLRRRLAARDEAPAPQPWQRPWTPPWVAGAAHAARATAPPDEPERGAAPEDPGPAAPLPEDPGPDAPATGRPAPTVPQEPASSSPPPLPAASERAADARHPTPAELVAALHGDDRDDETHAAPAGGTQTQAPPPPPRRTAQREHLAGVEQTLGLRWFTWVGIALLFLGIAFFLKYAYDRDWLGRFFGPRLRIATAAAIALTLAATGWRSLKNGMTGLGQGLLGGSQALLYLTIFAALQPALLVVDEPLLGPTTAFALMATVTAVGLVVAVRLDAIATAFLAVAGGFATPVLISTGQDSRDALCTYLLVLDLGVLAVALWRRWRAVDLLAFAGTALLFGGWWARWHEAHPQPDATLVWLCAFHLVFVLLPFAHHLRHRTSVAVERFALALANVAWTFGYAAWMLHEPAPRLLAAGCLAAAALYLALGVAVARRVGDDRRTRDGFLVLAALLLTLGLFYLMPVDAITTAWFVEAAALLWLGYRFGNLTTRVTALVVLGAAALRTLLVHLPTIDADDAFVQNRWLLQLVVAALGLAAFGWIHRRRADSDGERAVSRACGVGAGYWLLATAALEVARHARGHRDLWLSTPPDQVVAWLMLVGALAFLGWAARWPHRTTFVAALLPLCAAVVAAGVAYDDYRADALAALNGCFTAGLGACAVTAFAGHRARRHADLAAYAPGLLGASQLLLTGLLTVEVAAFVQRGDATPTARTLAQALAWAWLAAAYAGGALAAVWSSRRVLALAALPLVPALVAVIVAFADTPAAYRLIANERLVLAMLVAAAPAVARPLLRRMGAAGTADPAAAIGLVVAVVFGVLEAAAWSHASCVPGERAAHLVLLTGATFVVGAAGGSWRAGATQNRALHTTASLLLLPALLTALAVYLTAWDPRWMFVNLRVGLVTAAIATTLRHAREQRLGWLRWVAFSVALVAVSTEPPTWLLDNVEDPDEARRLALFSITVTWVLTAAALLFFGFARDRRPVRLTALALFALTAAKVLLLDMSGAQQLYRILAFVLVGVAFVCASWLYHRFERRLAARAETDAGSQPPAG